MASAFSLLSDDLLITILSGLESDPRDWARLSCVCSRFSSLIRNVCCRGKCPLLPFHPDDHPPGGWAALRKLSVCCPGETYVGVLLETSDFGLELDIGPNHIIHGEQASAPPSPPRATPQDASPDAASTDLGWTMFDDLYLDAAYDLSESDTVVEERSERRTMAPFVSAEERSLEAPPNKKRKTTAVAAGAHLAADSWAPSREQGSGLLAARFRKDRLYVSKLPGCVHAGRKREYKLFRGVFVDFKRSGVWRTIVDGGRKGSGLCCAFCPCTETWDLHSSFCLRAFGYHEDGEPVVRAYVCDSGHVSGAWTETPVW